MEPSLEDRVSEILIEYARTAPKTVPLTSEVSLRDDLAIESLSLVSVVLRFEDDFGLEIVDSAPDLNSLRTVGDVVNLVRTLLDTKRQNEK